MCDSVYVAIIFCVTLDSYLAYSGYVVRELYYKKLFHLNPVTHIFAQHIIIYYTPMLG